MVLKVTYKILVPFILVIFGLSLVERPNYVFAGDIATLKCSTILADITPLPNNWVGGRISPKGLLLNTVDHFPASNNPMGKADALFYIESFRSFVESVSILGNAMKISDGVVTMTTKNTGVEQVVEANTEYDEDLLEKSALDSSPHEVYKIRLLDHKNRNILNTGEIHHAYESVKVDSRRQVEIQDIEMETNSLMIEARISKSVEIELTHTHPFVQFLVIYDNDVQILLMTALSKSDIKFAVNSSMKMPEHVFTMRATTPSGVSFKVSYKDGKILVPYCQKQSCTSAIPIWK